MTVHSPTKMYLKQPDNTFKQFGEEVTGCGNNYFEVVSKYDTILNKPEDVFTLKVEEPDGSIDVFEMCLTSYKQTISSVSPFIYHKIEFKLAGEN